MKKRVYLLYGALIVIMCLICVDVARAQTPTPTARMCIDAKLPQVPTRTPAPTDYGGFCCFWYEACFWTNSVGTCFYTGIEMGTQQRGQYWESSRYPDRWCNEDCQAVQTKWHFYMPIIFRNYTP